MDEKHTHTVAFVLFEISGTTHIWTTYTVCWNVDLHFENKKNNFWVYDGTRFGKEMVTPEAIAIDRLSKWPT